MATIASQLFLAPEPEADKSPWVVWKFELDVVQNQMIQMPVDAKILSVGVQNDFPVVWVLTKGAGVPVKPRIFSVVTTGEKFTYGNPLDAVDGSHVGTVILGKDMASGNSSAWYVAHIFSCYLHVDDNKIDDRREIVTELRSE